MINTVISRTPNLIRVGIQITILMLNHIPFMLLGQRNQLLHLVLLQNKKERQ